MKIFFLTNLNLLSLASLLFFKQQLDDKHYDQRMWKSFGLSGDMWKIESIKKIKVWQEKFFDEEIPEMFLDNRNEIKIKKQFLF